MVEHSVPTLKAQCPGMGTECAVQHLSGSTSWQRVREKAKHPQTAHDCLLAIEEGDESGKA